MASSGLGAAVALTPRLAFLTTAKQFSEFQGLSQEDQGSSEVNDEKRKNMM